MLDEYILEAKNKEEFQSKVSNYFVNMDNNLRTLHITGCKQCQYSNWAFRFISFDTLESVIEFESNHKNYTPFRKCGNCFGKSL